MESAEQLMARAGLEAAEAAELLESGIVAIDLSAVPDEERLLVTRSEPVNVFSPTMNIDEYLPAGDGLDSLVVLVDTHTGSVFSPAHLSACALLGREGFRQSMAVGAEPFGWARVRFGSVPYFLCNTSAEFESLAAELRGDDAHVFFRGQTGDHVIRRTASVRRFLYGDDTVREISLPSSAFRNRFDYAAAETVAQALFDDILFRLTGVVSRSHWVEDAIEKVYVSNGGMAARLSARTMALAQHYGVPTFGLDVTRSSRLACWFATHAFDASTGKYASHQVTSDTSVHRRPVVYVLRSMHSVELGDLNLVATRPNAQDGVFVHGSWGLHGNVCAEDLVAVLVLGDGVAVCDEPLEAVFPQPYDDPVYRELLALKTSLTEEPFRPLLQYVYEVH